MESIEKQAIRMGKAFSQFMDFVEKCNSGESILYCGKNFIAMDIKSHEASKKMRYKKMVKRRKALSDQRGEIIDAVVKIVKKHSKLNCIWNKAELIKAIEKLRR